MSGLILNLKPGEKFLVNGIVLENGAKRGQIKIEGNAAKVLRLSDALHPENVDTPVKRAYYLAQLILSCDMAEEEAHPALLHDLKKLEFALMETDGGQLAKAIRAAEKTHYYSVLCHLKKVLPLEAALLNAASTEDTASDEAETKVA